MSLPLTQSIPSHPISLRQLLRLNIDIPSKPRSSICSLSHFWLSSARYTTFPLHSLLCFWPNCACVEHRLESLGTFKQNNIEYSSCCDILKQCKGRHSTVDFNHLIANMNCVGTWRTVWKITLTHCNDYPNNKMHSHCFPSTARLLSHLRLFLSIQGPQWYKISLRTGQKWIFNTKRYKHINDFIYDF